MAKDRHMFAEPGSGLTVGDQSHRGVDAEWLQLLGKKASARYVDGGGSLTDAVTGVLRDEEGLSQEHVRRVVESANNYAFEALFQKQAGDHRVVHFDGGPADPAAVLRELGATDAPIREKVASRNPAISSSERFVPGMDGLEDAFTSMNKTAASVQDYAYANPHRELFELRETVGRAKEELLSKMASLGMDYDDSFMRLYKEARQLVLNGHSPAEVAQVITSISPHANFTKLALRRISDHFEADVPALPGKTKVAGMINPKHPMCVAFGDFVKVASDYFRTAAAVEDLAEQYQIVDARVRRVLQ